MYCMPKRAKTPREEHPILIGCTESEAKALTKAAEACEMPRAKFIRMSALANAAKVNGVVK
jgi:uncharacterized protein (DUF1778 family)